MSNADAAIAGAESPRDEVDELIDAHAGAWVAHDHHRRDLRRAAGARARDRRARGDLRPHPGRWLRRHRRDHRGASARRRTARGVGDEPAERPVVAQPLAPVGAAGAASGRERGAGPAQPGAARPERTEGGGFDPVRMYLKEIGKVPLLTGRAGGDAGQADRGRRARHRAARRPQPRPVERRAPRLVAGRRGRRRASPRSSSPRPTCASWCRSPSATSGAGWRCSTSCRRATSASSVRSRSSTTRRASSSPPTRPGGSVRPSRARSPTRRAPSASRCTWSRP